MKHLVRRLEKIEIRMTASGETMQQREQRARVETLRRRRAACGYVEATKLDISGLSLTQILNRRRDELAAELRSDVPR